MACRSIGALFFFSSFFLELAAVGSFSIVIITENSILPDSQTGGHGAVPATWHLVPLDRFSGI